MLSESVSKIIFFALILLAVFLEVAADILFKKWSVENKAFLLGLGLLLYFIGTVFWAFSLKQESLSKAITVFTIINLIAVVLAGVIFFNEELTAINKIGIGLGILSIALIELG